MKGIFKSPKSSSDEMNFFEHLEVFRYALIRIIVVIGVFSAIAFLFKDFIYTTVILGPKSDSFISNRLLCEFGRYLSTENLCINLTDFTIINIEMAGQFKSHMLVSFVAGLIVGLPYMLWEFWVFVKPALYEKEASHFRGFVIVTSALFVLGLCFGYFLIAPLAINFLSTYFISPDVVNQIRLGSYIHNVCMISLSAGLVFELPIVVFFLSRIGMVNPRFLRKYRKHAIVACFVLSAIITPPDIISQFMVGLPLVILYEISIGISARVNRKYIAATEETPEMKG